jgi:hypothetical protein
VEKEYTLYNFHTNRGNIQLTALATYLTIYMTPLGTEGEIYNHKPLYIQSKPSHANDLYKIRASNFIFILLGKIVTVLPRRRRGC